ncbi:MAG: DUF3898 domain-containing protein [Gorillibacterium sp.]|nr:DUF3898 domain-containing protein [Gorillibacterium sp.]
MVQQYMDTKWQGQDGGELEADDTTWSAGSNRAEGYAGSEGESGMLHGPGTAGASGYTEQDANAAAGGYTGDHGSLGQGGVAGAFGREGGQSDDGAGEGYRESNSYLTDGNLAQGLSHTIKDGHGVGEIYGAGDPENHKPRKISDARRQEEARLEIWAAGEKRELQERWNHEQVVDAAAQIVELQPDWEMKFKLDGVSVRAKMEEYGKSVHLAKLNGRYVVLIEGDSFQFEKARSPIELLHPEALEDVITRMKDEQAKREHERESEE